MASGRSKGKERREDFSFHRQVAELELFLYVSERLADNPAHALLSRCSTLICPHNSLDLIQPFQNNLLLLWLRLLSGAVFVFFVLQSEGWKPNCADACRIILNVSAAEAGVNADTGYGSPSEVDSVERDKEKKR